jgi:hypothetical protein
MAMERRAFLGGTGAAVLATGTGTAVSGVGDTPASTPASIDVNGDQVMGVLTDIDRSGDEALIDAVFGSWGYHCFHSRRELEAFVQRQALDFRGYLEYVNSGRARFWERLEYDEPGGVLKVIGRKSSHCACPYAQCAQPPKSLCTHCCRAFQVELFRCLTGRPVSVQIDEAILLGGERCSTTVRLLGEG